MTDELPAFRPPSLPFISYAVEQRPLTAWHSSVPIYTPFVLPNWTGRYQVHVFTCSGKPERGSGTEMELIRCLLSWANYCTVLPNDGLKETMDFWVSWIIFSRLSTLVAPSYCHLCACPPFQCAAKAWGIMKPVTWDSTQRIKDKLALSKSLVALRNHRHGLQACTLWWLILQSSFSSHVDF